MRDVIWVGSSQKDVRKFPEEAQEEIIFALEQAREGEKHVSARPMKGFHGAGVLEIRTDEGGDAYRTVYAVTLPDAVYVLHAFQKKSKRGIATPQRELDLTKSRFERARELSRARMRDF